MAQFLVGGDPTYDTLRVRDLATESHGLRPLAELIAAAGPIVTAQHRQLNLPWFADRLRRAAQVVSSGLDDFSDYTKLAPLIAAFLRDSTQACELADVAAVLRTRGVNSDFRLTAPHRQFSLRFSRVITHLPNVERVVGSSEIGLDFARALNSGLGLPSNLNNIADARGLDAALAGHVAALGFVSPPLTTADIQQRVTATLKAHQQHLSRLTTMAKLSTDGDSIPLRGLQETEDQENIFASRGYLEMAAKIDALEDETNGALQTIGLLFQECKSAWAFQVAWGCCRLSRDPRGVFRRAIDASEKYLGVVVGRALMTACILQSNSAAVASEELLKALRGTRQGGTGMDKLNWHQAVIAIPNGEPLAKPLSNKELLVHADLAEVFFQRISDLLDYCGFTESGSGSFKAIIEYSRPLGAGKVKASLPFIAELRYGAVMTSFRNFAFAPNKVAPNSKRELFIRRDATTFWHQLTETKEGLRRKAQDDRILGAIEPPPRRVHSEKRRDGAYEDGGDNARARRRRRC